MSRSEGEGGGSCRFPVRGKTGKEGRPGLLKRLWRDDRGAVLASEWILLTTIMLVGIVPALIAIRHGVLSKLFDLSGATTQLDQSYGFTGTAIDNEWRHRDRGTLDRDGKAWWDTPLRSRTDDPVLEEAEKVCRRDLDPAWPDRPCTRRPRVHAFAAGSLFLEERHLDRNDRRPVITSRAVPAD